MPETGSTAKNTTQNGKALLWDMAGTLIAYDSSTGRASAIPGGEEFLPEMGKVFRLVVTTGDETDNARSMLAGFELLPHFETVYGNLYTPLGKPYGRILREMGCRPELSLAIGDRLRADIPADSHQVVTVLINQKDEVINAGMVQFLINILQTHGETFPEAFYKLTEKAEPAPDEEKELLGGQVNRAWNYRTGFGFQLMEFDHPLLDGRRLVIVI